MKRSFAILATLATLALGLVVLSAPGAHAQGTVTAQGRVVDGDGNPIPDVQVLLDYRGHIVQKYRTKTDKKGVFTHVNVFQGPYRITLTKEGFVEHSFDYNIREIASLEKPPDFKLLPPRAQAAPPPGSGMAPAGPAPGGAPVDTNKLAADINAAMALSKEGRTDEAISAYEGILAIAPTIPLVHYNLGNAYKKKGDRPKAEAAMRRSIELDPLFVDGYVGLATVLAEGGKRDEAIQVVQEGAAANEKSGRLQYALGVLAEGSGDAALAKRAFLEAERLDPQNVETQYHLATVALNMNDKPGAIARLEKFVASAPEGTPNVDVAKSLLAALKK